MASLKNIEDLLLPAQSVNPSSVLTWNPPFSGKIDITVKANGDWYHEGSQFTRLSLVKLFSSILKKEGNDYFLVTPVEKWKITVEDSPLLVIDMEIIENALDLRNQKVNFRTSVDDIFCLDQQHPLRIISNNSDCGDQKPRPYILVRSNIEALIHRNVFYRLVEKSVLHNEGYGIWSAGEFFPLE